jgi:hypothetical protein
METTTRCYENNSTEKIDAIWGTGAHTTVATRSIANDIGRIILRCLRTRSVTLWVMTAVVITKRVKKIPFRTRDDVNRRQEKFAGHTIEEHCQPK